MSSSPSKAAWRIGAIAGTAAVVVPLLAACSSGSGAVSYDGKDSSAVQSATIQFSGQGTFVERDTLDPAEYSWSGSGFFIAPDGTAVTNNHVVTGAGTLSVTIGGDTSKTYPVHVVSTSECLDIAVVKVDAGRNVPFFAWAEGPVSTGSDVYALGYPLGDPTFSMTKGAVVKSDYAFDTYDNVVQHGIQSDATIRGGNSGGPLINPEGKVVGVNFYGNDQIATSNYAIGRDDVLPVLADLRAGKSVLSLGLNLAALSTDDEYGLSGLWVQSVAEGSAADKAGIEPGDVIQKLAGVTMAGPSSLSKFENTSEGTMKNYCDVLQTKGVEVYRPSTDELLEGEVNGTEEIEVTQSGVYGGTEEVSSGYETVSSDDARIFVDVPAEWSDTSTDVSGDATTFQASSDIDAFNAFQAEGVEILDSPYQENGTPEEVLATLDANIPTALGCTPIADQADQPYDDGYYAGLWSAFTDCSTGADVAIVVVDAADQSRSGYVLIVGTFGSNAASDATVAQILNTFTLL